MLFSQTCCWMSQSCAVGLTIQGVAGCSTDRIIVARPALLEFSRAKIHDKGKVVTCGHAKESAQLEF